jgi:ATP-dependent Clp protease, protease subunit
MPDEIKEVFTNNPKPLYIADFSDDAVAAVGEAFQDAIENSLNIMPVYINSFGGEVENLLAMVDIFNTFPGKVVTIAMGKAMSAGAFLLACGTSGYRYATPNTTMMIHHLGVTGLEGKTQDMEVEAAVLKKLQKRIFGMLDSKCSQKSGFFLKLLKEGGNTDLFLDAEEAKNLHLIDHIKFPIMKRREVIDFEQ